MRKFTLSICAAICMLAGSAWAIVPRPETGFSGTFKDDHLTLSLKAEGDKLNGTMTLGDQAFPVEAGVNQGRLSGVFISNATRFDFTADLKGDTLELASGGRIYHLMRVKQSVAAPAAGAASQPGADDGSLHFRTFELKDDPRMIGGVAVTCLVPADWKVEGTVVWRAISLQPASFYLRAANPRGSEQMAALPNIPCTWNTRPGPFFPKPGQTYMGYEVREPMDGPTAIRQLIIPRYLKDLPADARMTQCEAFPDYARALAGKIERDPNLPPKIEGARAHLEFNENGKAMEMDIYCLVISTQMPMIDSIYWQPDYITVFKAEKGHLSDTAGILFTIAQSARAEPQWAIRYQQLLAALQRAQLQSIRDIGEMSRRAVRDADENMARLRADYEKRSTIMEKQQAEFSKVIRGVDDYRRSDGSSVELPTGYQHAYYNGATGEYIVGNRGLDPGTSGWTELRRNPN